jgi:hypothetical protein
MIVYPVIPTASTSDVLAPVSGLFGSFSPIIVLVLGVFLGFWILQFVILTSMRQYQDHKANRAINLALEVIKKSGYETIAPPTENEIELQKALGVLKGYGIKTRKSARKTSVKPGPIDPASEQTGD